MLVQCRDKTEWIISKSKKWFRLSHVKGDTDGNPWCRHLMCLALKVPNER